MSEKIVIEERNETYISKVKEVDSFCEREIKLILFDDVRLVIRGENLKILSYAKDSGEFKLKGRVFEFKFTEKKLGFIKRALK